MRVWPEIGFAMPLFPRHRRVTAETGLSGEGYVVELTVSKGGWESTVTEDIRVNEQTVSFSGRILGLFTTTGTSSGATCTSCHNTADVYGTGLNLTVSETSALAVYNELVNNNSITYGVPVVTPFDPDNSVIVSQVTNGHTGPRLLGDDLDDLRTWINEGALNN